MPRTSAPTAGLHFTPELMEKIRDKGAKPIFLTLHVGWDSFRLIRAKSVESHTLNSEYYEISEKAANEINSAIQEKRRIISIGTTSVRLLEHVAKVNSEKDLPLNFITPGSGWADTFIIPGHTFRVINSLVTNFHLPQSTLLMLTCAFGGRNLIMRAYTEASDDTGIPIILQAGPSCRAFTPIPILGKMFRHLADQTKTPICCHLDHGFSYKECNRRCLCWVNPSGRRLYSR